MRIYIDVWADPLKEGAAIYPIEINRDDIIELACQIARWDKKIIDRIKLDGEISSIEMDTPIKTKLDNNTIIDKP